ncbi:MAG: hypothetical protein Rubg2KO_05000 [Rubricoccaceae bacterium]
MDFLSNPIAARALWLAPILMLVIAIALVPAGVAQRDAAESGETIQAEVVSVNLRERSEITRGEAVLRYTPPGASSRVERPVEMPLVLLKDLQVDFESLPEGETLTIPIRASASSDQIVLGAHSRAQWILTFSFAAMALIGAIGLAILVRGWNRLLRTQGDPARRPHPAAT